MELSWSVLEPDALIATLLPPATGLRELLALVKSHLPQAHMACGTHMVEDSGISKTGEQNCVHLLILSLTSVFSCFKLEILKLSGMSNIILQHCSFASCLIGLDLIICAALV